MAISVIPNPLSVVSTEGQVTTLSVTAVGGTPSLTTDIVVKGTPIAVTQDVTPWVKLDLDNSWRSVAVIGPENTNFAYTPEPYSSNKGPNDYGLLAQTISLPSGTNQVILSVWQGSLSYDNTDVGAVKLVYLDSTNQTISESIVLGWYNPTRDGYDFRDRVELNENTKLWKKRTNTINLPFGTISVQVVLMSESEDVFPDTFFTKVVLGSTATTYSYELFKDGVLVSTNPVYEYTSNLEDSGKNFLWKVTSAGEVAYSDYIVIYVTADPLQSLTNITLKAENNKGTYLIPLISGSSTLTYSVEPSDFRFNQYDSESLDGTFACEERSAFTICRNSILILSVPKDIAEGFRKFVSEVLHLSEVPFTLSLTGNDCVSSDMVNFGHGFEKNPVVLGCSLTVESDTIMFRYKEPGVYDIQIPYEFLRVG